MHAEVDAYLARLPRGAASYPDCLVQASIYEDLRSELPPLDPRDTGRLPPGLGAYIRHGTPGEWIPEVWASSLMELWYATACGRDEDAARARLRGLNAGVIELPAFRALVRVLSPSLALMGFARAWGINRRGTTARAALGSRHESPRTAEVIIDCPPHLFSTRQIWGFEETFRLVANVLRLGDYHVPPAEVREDGLRFPLQWTDR